MNKKGKKDKDDRGRFTLGDKAHTSSNQRLCHLGPKLVFEREGLEVYGASLIEASTYYKGFDLVISLGEDVEMEGAKNLTHSILKSINLIRLLKEYCPENLYLTWQDFGTPTYGLAFWKNLVEILRKKGRDRKRRGKAYKVMVHCMGGHGRTGTALAILGGLGSRWVEEDGEVDLVEKVRGVYCHHAVETYRQVKYVEEITGRGSKAEVVARGVNTSKIYPTEYPSTSFDVFIKSFESTSGGNKGSVSKHSFTDPSPSSLVVEEELKNIEKVEKRGREVNVIVGGVARLEGESVEEWKRRARGSKPEAREKIVVDSVATDLRCVCSSPNGTILCKNCGYYVGL